MKTIEEIYGELLSDFGRRTGMEPREGSDLSARMYALAAQVYGLYVQAEWVVRQAFPQTAEGEYLDYHAQLRSIQRKTAIAAEGTVRFTAGEAVEYPRYIPQGTICMTAGMVRFETTRVGVLEAGAVSADVPVKAVEPGAAGNISAGAIVAMTVAPIGIAYCTNPLPCVGGSDAEGDEELRQRVLETFRRLPNGANAAFYQQGALSFDQVAAAEVISRPRGTGTVDVVVATSTGLPDEKLLKDLEDYFKQRREIAVDLQVKAPRSRTVDLSVQVKAREGWDGEQVRSGVEESLRRWFDGKLLGQDVLRAQLGQLIFGCDGVANYTITAPAEDVAGEADVLPQLGTVSVEAME